MPDEMSAAIAALPRYFEELFREGRGRGLIRTRFWRVVEMSVVDDSGCASIKHSETST